MQKIRNFIRRMLGMDKNDYPNITGFAHVDGTRVSHNRNGDVTVYAPGKLSLTCSGQIRLGPTN